jgi:hypothetical protein
VSRAFLAVNGRSSGVTARVCTGFVDRARGQLGARGGERGQAWWLAPCAAVHTLFLREPIDVLFCDAKGSILRLVTPLGVNRCAWHRGAASVWELPQGWSGRLGLRRGDRLSLCA